MSFPAPQGVELIVWTVIFTIIITAVMVLRFWAVAIVLKRSLRLDDYFIILAYISTICLEAVAMWAVHNGLGAHTSELNLDQLNVQFKLILASGFTWLGGTVFCKLSILYMYTCIFTNRAFKIASWTLGALIAAYGVSFLVVFSTNCTPISQQWAPVPGGHCKSVMNEEIASVSLNMAMDGALVVLPLPALWGLQMAFKKKVGVSFLFSLGLAVMAIMAWRLAITVQSATQTDFVYGLANIGLAALLEVWLGIIVACVPVLAPLFKKYLKPMVTRLTKNTRGTAGSSMNKQSRGGPQHTIGGSGYSKKNPFKRLDRDSFMELEEGKNLNTVVAHRSTSSISEEEHWMSDPTAINVKRSVQVHSEEVRSHNQRLPGGMV